MSPEPDVPGAPPQEPQSELAALRAEREALERRALEAEAIAEQLAERLGDAQRRLAQGAAGPTPPAEQPGDYLTLFDGTAAPGRGARLAPDGSDRAVLPIALAATALVAALVGVLTAVAGRLSFFTVVAFGAAALLAWGAARTRVRHVSVRVVDGVVEVTEGDTTRRFDLRNDTIKVDVQGQPGDPGWRVRFYRRALDPVDVDSTMVDPAEFMAALREYRPGL